MVAPVIAAAGISAASSLLGGVLDRKASKKSAKKQREMDLMFARNQIQWKVADAKDAGIHPLYALGSGGSYQPTQIIPGQSSMGSAVADAGAAVANGMNQARAEKANQPIVKAQREAINASVTRDEAAAALDRSKAAREIQEFNIRQDQLINTQPPPNLYEEWYNNASGENVWLPNKDAGLEIPESIGGAYWVGGKALDKPKNPAPRPDPRSGAQQIWDYHKKPFKQFFWKPEN